LEKRGGDKSRFRRSKQILERNKPNFRGKETKILIKRRGEIK